MHNATKDQIEWKKRMNVSINSFIEITMNQMVMIQDHFDSPHSPECNSQSADCLALIMSSYNKVMPNFAPCS